MTIGIVVVAGDGPRTARTLDSVIRQADPVDQVAVVLAPDADRRLVSWLAATCTAQGWQLVHASKPGSAPAANEAVATMAAAWVVVLEAGEALRPASVGWLRQWLESANELSAAACRARIVSLGIDETVSPADPQSPAAFDPLHPALRAMVWRRSAIIDAGGFDSDLPVAARYDLWLRLLGRGKRVGAVPATIAEVPVDTGSPLAAETADLAVPSVAARLHARHAALLAAHIGDVLEARAGRVSRLGSAYLRALERHREAERSTAAMADYGPPPASGTWRASPLSRQWGYDRGGPLDRHYVEQFLERHAADVRGAVLEVQEPDYTRRFGGAAVTRSDVVDLVVGNTGATLITDLRRASNVADGTYDCVILTQTLHVIPQMAEVVAECHRILKPGGVLLLTAPSVSRVCLEYGRDGDFWRLTPAGARVLVEPVFGDDVEVTAVGNAGAGAAFLAGAGRDELTDAVLAPTDAYHPTLVTVRAVKARGADPGAPATRSARHSRGLVLLYHRVGGADADPHALSIPESAFDRQAAWLADACAVLPLDELVEGVRRHALPARAVAITFDDGYLDTLTKAAPILAAHRLPATCFATTEGLDGSHEFWWDQLASALLGSGPRPSSLRLQFPDREEDFSTATSGERLFAHGLIYHAIVRATREVRSSVLTAVRTWAGTATTSPDGRRMTAAEITRLAAAGFAIGAHTVGHPQLPQLSRPDQVREIVDSRLALERVLAIPVRSLAFPFGAWDVTTIAAAAEAGVTTAFTCEPRAMSATDDLLRLPRLDPQTARLDRFAPRIESEFVRVS